MNLPLSASFSRRQLFQTTAAFAAGAGSTQLAALPGPSLLAAESAGTTAGADLATAAAAIRFSLNMSTIRGQKLALPEQVKVAAKAGYSCIEPWLPDLKEFVQAGGQLADLKKQIADAGLTVESAIGFAEWIVDDAGKRKAGLESAKQDMDIVKQIGGIRIAAPPSGATKQTDLNLFAAAERYRQLLELGQQMEVKPQLEVWGFSSSLSKLGEVLLVAIEAQHPTACILPDVYHLHKGGSGFGSLRMVAGKAIDVFHMNDYPADPPRESINDSHRVYPGDGIAPLGSILRDLLNGGFRGILSLELFNQDYWKQDPNLVAATGLAKMKASLANAVAGK